MIDKITSLWYNEYIVKEVISIRKESADMKDMMFDEFQKYAKEVFGYDVKRDTSKSESFEELFKRSFVEREKKYEQFK